MSTIYGAGIAVTIILKKQEFLNKIRYVIQQYILIYTNFLVKI